MSRLPELEQELVATAARLRHRPRRFERGARTIVPAVALACLVAIALVAGGLFDSEDDGGRSGSPAAADARFPANATLEDMFGIFRRPQTAADRQPGEDVTQSRRVEWPAARIYVWPERDGICYGVRGGSGCVPLDVLARTGVSVGAKYGRGRRSVYGVVVDGIREVVITVPDGPDLRVPVRENFFFADVGAAVDRVRWRYAGEERSFALPNAAFDPLPASLSDPVRFTAGGVRFSAVGYQAANDTVCMRVAEEGTDRPALACQGIRGLRKRLAEEPAELFAGGGTAHGLMTHKGFARADVTDVEVVERASDMTVVLSEPWTPAPWDGEPIRFLLVYDSAPGEPDPRNMEWPRLRVRLADGRTYLIES